VERETRLELATSSLEGMVSTQGLTRKDFRELIAEGTKTTGCSIRAE
jgi:hypothetical protein